MPTIVELAANGALEFFAPELGHRRQTSRLVYLKPGVMDWIEEHLPDAQSDCFSEITPVEQLDEILNAFCAGESLVHERQMKILHHRIHGVWELKTPDLRLFGWFPKKDVFVCTAINFKRLIRDHSLYQGYVGAAVHFRENLDLNEPKFIPGDDPNGVATNIS